MNNVNNLNAKKLMRKGVRFKYYNEEYLIVQCDNRYMLKTINLNRSYISLDNLDFWRDAYERGVIEIINSPKQELIPAMKVKLVATGSEYIIVKSGASLRLLSFPACIMQVDTTERIQVMYDNGDLVIIEE